MEFDNKLIEASSLSPVEKMRLFNAGARDSNVGAMSDDKLLNNQKICIDNGYCHALSKIEDEMIYRGLIKAHSIDYLKLFFSSDTIDKLTEAIDLKSVFAEQFKYIQDHISDPEAILKDADTGLGTKYTTITDKNILKVFGLLYCILLHAPIATIDRIKKALTDPYDSADPHDNALLGVLSTSEENVTILKHLITLISNDTAIMAKITDFVNNKFTESYDIELKSSDNLEEDIESHEELNPKLWNNNKLKPEVADKINQIVTYFLDGLAEDEISMIVKDIILVGSNASYNYTDDSDIDIHIIAENLKAPEELYSKIYSAYRSIFNTKFEIDFYNIPVELYIETEGMPRVSNGCYSVMNNEWIKEPAAEDIPELDQEAFDKEFKIWEDRYNKIMADAKKELKEEINDTNKVSNNRGKNMERNFSNFDDAIDALNEINDEEEVKEVVDDTEEIEANEKVADNNCIAKTANDVMMAYQNANKWLDSVKEAIYINLNCPFFSSFVHELAHTIPSRFDSFGDILHTVNMEIPYPATAEISKKPATLDEAFTIIFSTLDAIKAALNAFIKCTDEDYHGMSCAAEACLNDIEGEYPMLYRLQAKAKECGDDTITFDKFVGQYVEHKDGLLESLKEAYPVDKSGSREEKVMWIVANNKEFFRKAFANEIDAEFKKLKKDAFTKVKNKFSCSTADVNELLEKAAILYHRLYESKRLKESGDKFIDKVLISSQEHADKIKKLLEDAEIEEYFYEPYIGTEKGKTIIELEVGLTGWEGTYKDVVIKDDLTKMAIEILEANGYNNLEEIDDGVWASGVIIYLPENLQ